MAKLGREKICVLVRGDVERLSDICGILHLSYDEE
jgi:predicted nucleotide-binding protein